MARSRNIKPGFFHNDELAELDPIDRLFFIGLWTVCDFKGCVEYRPKKLKAQILPYDNADAEVIAINLDKSGFISIYSVQGKKYLKILNFTKHQNPHKNERAAGSSIPDIDLNDSQVVDSKGVETKPDKIGTNPDLHHTDRADSLLLIPDSLNHINTIDQSAIDLDNLFESFWLAGMKKTNKKKARSLFTNLLKKQSNQSEFTDKLITDIKTRLDINQLGFAEMHPTTYLNGERWTDEVKPNEQDRSNQNTASHKLSVVERTRLANEERELRRQEELRAHYGSSMVEATRDIRPPVEQSVRGNDAGELGTIIDGSFSRTN